VECGGCCVWRCVVRCGKNTTARPLDVHAPARRRRVAHAARAHCACAARSRIYAHRPHRTHHNHARSSRTLHDGSSRDRCPLRAGSRTAHPAEKPRGAERSREKPRCCVDQPASTALSPSRCVSRLTLHAIPCARHARTHTHTHPILHAPCRPRREAIARHDSSNIQHTRPSIQHIIKHIHHTSSPPTLPARAPTLAPPSPRARLPSGHITPLLLFLRGLISPLAARALPHRSRRSRATLERAHDDRSAPSFRAFEREIECRATRRTRARDAFRVKGPGGGGGAARLTSRS
jgi:hypothetical protein